MVWSGRTIRIAQRLAVCVLVLSCGLLTPALAEDSNSVNPGSASSSTAKKAGASSVPKQHSASSSSSRKTASKTSGRRSRRKSSRVRGQQKIDSDRARLIQEALIREHYLTGEPTGSWNQACEDAMRRYQADHGWQSKTVPDSRALISLGLGPSKDHLLNPESAMTTVPDSPKSDTVAPTSHSSPATGVPVPASSSSPATTSAPPTSDTASPQ